MDNYPPGTSGNYKSKIRHGRRTSEMYDEIRDSTIKYIDTKKLFSKMDNNLKRIDTTQIQEKIKSLTSDNEINEINEISEDFLILIESKNKELTEVIDEKNEWQKNHDFLEKKISGLKKTEESRIPSVSAEPVLRKSIPKGSKFAPKRSKSTPKRRKFIITDGKKQRGGSKKKNK